MHSITPELSETELDELTGFLDSLPNAMNLEKFDGFLCALIAGPDIVMPSEYLPIALGCQLDAVDGFDTPDDAYQTMGLITKHWNSIATRLSANEVHAPLLLKDDAGIERGIDWAKGFMIGVAIRHENWQALIEDEKENRNIVPMLALAEADDPNSTLKTRSESFHDRIRTLTLITACVLKIYKFFQRRRSPQSISTTIRRTESKVGRNDLCPCGSGAKYKNCCLRKQH